MRGAPEVPAGGAGSPPPLGATWDGGGVHFALWSRHATGVWVCLFAAAQGEGETARIPLAAGSGGVWRGYVPGPGPGQLYGFRVDGPYEPPRGHLFNPAKLLVDPYARAVAGELVPHPSLHGHRPGTEAFERDGEDSAPWVPKGVVVDPAFDWGDDRPPRVPWPETVIYECHVRGMTRRHPEVPEELRGTYLGLADPVVVEHLLALGVTAVELLPVQGFVSRPELRRRRLTNYWGYDPVAWFAPHGAYATADRGAQVREFKTMVRALHRAGLEVILDVVFNHSAEGQAGETTLSLRGIDHAAYYRLRPGETPLLEDTTGCGNTLDASGPPGLTLVLDSLRYWVAEMHVDGFRFDLAPALARVGGRFDPRAPLFGAIAEDPILSRVKLIAEPWDLGPGGLQVGRFPDGWAEWNGRYRDAVRSFWRGDRGREAELATRLAGSSDLYVGRDLGPAASVNYVTSHDGLTLRDLVSYERKHNRANGEDNRDGSDRELSANWGVEGPSDDPVIRSRRLRVQRSMLATLAFSRGTPMLSHGDELGRTQGGNNNPYCQDNETTWVDWRFGAEVRDLLAFIRRAFALRRRYPALRRGRFFTGEPPGAGRKGPGSSTGEPPGVGGGKGPSSSTGKPPGATGPQDLTWLTPEGSEIGPEAWGDAPHGTLAMLIQEPDEPPLLLLLNAAANPRTFRLPEPRADGRWRLLLHSDPEATAAPAPRSAHLTGHSLALLVCDDGDQ